MQKTLHRLLLVGREMWLIGSWRNLYESGFDKKNDTLTQLKRCRGDWTSIGTIHTRHYF